MPWRQSRTHGARRGQGAPRLDPSTLSPERAAASAYTVALHMLARRELSEARIRDRLSERGYEGASIEQAILRLRGTGAIDDDRAVRACARTLVLVRRRGPLRARRELEQMGFPRDLVAAVLGDLFDAQTESRQLEASLTRQLRGRNANLSDPGVFRRVQGALVRRGFSPSRVRSVLLARAKARGAETIDESPDEPDE